MIVFPVGFIETRYPGYYFEPSSNQLYSIKITGMLKPLKPQKYWNPNNNYRGNASSGLIHGEGGYQVSHKGRRHFMPLRELKLLKPSAYIIPVWNDEETK